MEATLCDLPDFDLWTVGGKLIVFGILLPSFDVYSDLAFSYALISGTYEPCPKGKIYYSGTSVETECTGIAEPQPNYGKVMLIPIMLATLFTIPHWLKRENTLRKRLYTLPLLLGQFWPQWQVIKILRLMTKRNPQWQTEKKNLEKEVSSLGKVNLLENM